MRRIKLWFLVMVLSMVFSMTIAVNAESRTYVDQCFKNMVVGETIDLSDTLKEGYELINWSIDNNSIATLDEEFLTALSPGEIEVSLFYDYQGRMCRDSCIVTIGLNTGVYRIKNNGKYLTAVNNNVEASKIEKSDAGTDSLTQLRQLWIITEKIEDGSTAGYMISPFLNRDTFIQYDGNNNPLLIVNPMDNDYYIGDELWLLNSENSINNSAITLKDELSNNQNINFTTTRCAISSNQQAEGGFTYERVNNNNLPRGIDIFNKEDNECAYNTAYYMPLNSEKKLGRFETYCFCLWAKL